MEPEVDMSRHEELLSRRRLTVLSGSDQQLVSDEMDNEEIIEGSLLVNIILVEKERFPNSQS